MGERAREGVFRRVIRAIAGEAKDARQAAIERTSAKYPDAYPPGSVEQERKKDDAA